MTAPAAPSIKARDQGGVVVRITIPAVTGAVSYGLFRDGEPLDNVLAGITYDATVVADETYEYRATSINAEEEESALSDPARVHVLDPAAADTTPTPALDIYRRL